MPMVRSLLVRMDVVIEALLKPCDVRALVPVIEGAGGKLTNWEGGSAVNGGRIIAVGDPLLLPKIIDALKARALTYNVKFFQKAVERHQEIDHDKCLFQVGAHAVRQGQLYN